MAICSKICAFSIKNLTGSSSNGLPKQFLISTTLSLDSKQEGTAALNTFCQTAMAPENIQLLFVNHRVFP